MSGEIRVNFSATVSNGFFNYSINPGPIAIDQDNMGRGGHVQEIGYATSEILDFGDISAAGRLFLQNMDEDNYVTFGPDSSGTMIPIGKLLPGEFTWIPLSAGAVMRAQANTASVLLRVDCFEA